MSYDPNDFQDQAAIAAMLQRQRMINSQNQQQNIPKNRQCPWCGGLLPGQYSKCQHCSSDVSWVDGFPYKPKDADYLRQEIIAKRNRQKAEERRLKAEAEKLKSEIAARVAYCKKCTCRVPQTDLISTVNTCKKCADVEKFVYIIVAIAVLTVIVTLIIGLRAKHEQNQLLVYVNVTIAALTSIGTSIIWLRAKNKLKQFLEAETKAKQLAAEEKAKAKQLAAEGKAKAQQLAAEEKAKAEQQAEEEKAKLTEKIGSGQVGSTLDLPLGREIVMRFAFCPAGSLMIAWLVAEDSRSSDKNQASINIGIAFWMAKTEVTQGQWSAIMGSNPSHFTGDNLPVENVTWYDAERFIEKVNDSGVIPKGWKMALPTDAQWEYACRAGETGPYSGGTIDQVAWFDGNSGGKTHVVGTKKPNAWGLHDMYGNVWEWCSDRYDDSLSGGSDQSLRLASVEHLVRGHSWSSHATNSANRRRENPAVRRSNLGFRPAIVPSE